MSPLLRALIAATAATSVACAARSDDPSSQDEAEAAASNAQASQIGYVVMASVVSQDPLNAADSVGTNPQIWPAGCVTRARAKDPAAAQVTLTFSSCTGPFGLEQLSGDIVVTFSANLDGTLHADHESRGLTVNGSPAALTASADITVSGTTRNVEWHANWTRLDARGDSILHTSDLTIVMDAVTRCRDANGSAKTTIASREVDTKVEDYSICVGTDGIEGCPSGILVHTHAETGRTVTVMFDGTAVASVVGPNGGEVREPLACGR